MTKIIKILSIVCAFGFAPALACFAEECDSQECNPEQGQAQTTNGTNKADNK